jgi:hypothetical protein
MNCKNRLPLAIPLLAFAAVASAAPSQGTAQQHAVSTRQTVAKAAEPLDLRPPNFFAPQWQRRLQGPPIDHSLDYLPSMEYVVVTPAPEAPNTSVAPAGLGSVYWALMHPFQAWRVIMPAQPGDELDTDHQLAMANYDAMSDCPGFRGTPNVRPICP